MTQFAYLEIQGRTTDFVTAIDGTVMHGLAPIYVVRDLPGIEAFRVVQESLGRTRVEVVPENELPDATRETIVHGMRERLGENVDVDVEIVAEIPREPSGKYRYVKSRVPTEETRG